MAVHTSLCRMLEFMAKSMRKKRKSFHIFLVLVILWTIQHYFSILLKGRSSSHMEIKTIGWINTLPSAQKLHVWHGNVSQNGKNRLSCIMPIQHLWDENLQQFFSPTKKIKCSSETDWITVKNGTFIIDKDILKANTDVICVYRSIERHTDDTTYRLGQPITVHHRVNKEHYVMKHDYYAVSCTAGEQKYQNVHAGIHHDPELHKTKISTRGTGLNVLMFGLDSVSRLTYSRKLPLVVDYFKHVLDGVILQGYNIVGDGTPQALIPILTGKTELELPMTLRRVRNRVRVDEYPMIWRNFKKAGYVTAWSEDNPDIGTFTYRMTGFRKQPTDHYLRPFFLHATTEYNQHRKLCLGDKRRTKIHLNWLKALFSMYSHTPIFGFGFHSEASHSDDLNLVQTAEDDLLDTLRFMNKEGYLQNTMLILMSDHGARFHKVREFIQGKQEERNPFVGIYMPNKFRTKYRAAYMNLVTNSKKLTSPFDLFPTFLDILNYPKAQKGTTANRSISLFDEIPVSRTCSHAGIEPHWCNCLAWFNVDTNQTIVRKAAKYLLEFMNSITAPANGACHVLKLFQLKQARTLSPTEELLRFKKSLDMDGRKPDMSGNTKIKTVTMELKIVTEPGNGHFEATILYMPSTNSFQTTTNSISRSNRYGNAPRCIYNTYEQMRPYCFCKL